MKSLVVGAALIAAAVFAPVTDAALKRVKAEGGIQVRYVVRADVKTAKRGTLLVRTVKLDKTSGGAVRIDCPRKCQRRSGGAPKIKHRGGDTTVTGLNVLLSEQLTLRVKVIVPNGLSGYIELGVRNGELRIVSAGCLGKNARDIACPGSSPGVPVQAATPDAPVVVDAAPTATSAPVATEVPGVNPRGALVTFGRLDAGRVRITGWARDADADDATIAVRALIDGASSGEGPADKPFGTLGPHGFDLIAVTDESPHTICAVGVNILGGSDAQVGSCRSFAEFADLDADGKVGCTDLAILQAHYGQDGGYAQGDLNADVRINAFDLSALLSRLDPGETC
jgi:hypothetical protein